MKKKMLVIVNPISGVGRQKKIERLLNSNLNLDIYDYEVRYTEHIHHGTELARQGAMEGFDVITAVGGDGSVNDVIAGMHGSDATLGIIPCGSGNGLARCMKIPLTPAFAIRVLNQDNEGLIDTIILNEQYYIASIAGVGFDAYIARLMKAAKMRGFSAYLNLILREYPSYESKDYTLVIDGKEYEMRSNNFPTIDPNDPCKLTPEEEQWLLKPNSTTGLSTSVLLTRFPSSISLSPVLWSMPTTSSSANMSRCSRLTKSLWRAMSTNGSTLTVKART